MRPLASTSIHLVPSSGTRVTTPIGGAVMLFYTPWTFSSLHSIVISRQCVYILNIYLHTWGIWAHVYTVPHLDTCTLVLMRWIGMPGHAPHTEWLSVLFIPGTSRKLKTASEHAQPCIRVEIYHNKKCNTSANSQGCLQMIMLFYPECIHNNSLRPFSHVYHRPMNTFHILMYSSDACK